MPVWQPAFDASGLAGPLNSVLHVMVEGTGPDFLLRLGPLGDVIPIPFWPVQNVASLGDLFLTAGLGFFLFATLVRTPAETQAAIDDAKTGRYLGVSGVVRLPRREGDAGEPGEAAGIGVRPGTGLTPGLQDAAALERPLVMGAGGMGMSSPSQVTLVSEGAAAAAIQAGIAVLDGGGCWSASAATRTSAWP